MLRTFLYWVVAFVLYLAGGLVQALGQTDLQPVGVGLGILAGAATVVFAIYLGNREIK